MHLLNVMISQMSERIRSRFDFGISTAGSVLHVLSNSLLAFRHRDRCGAPSKPPTATTSLSGPYDLPSAAIHNRMGPHGVDLRLGLYFRIGILMHKEEVWSHDGAIVQGIAGWY